MECFVYAGKKVCNEAEYNAVVNSGKFSRDLGKKLNVSSSQFSTFNSIFPIAIIGVIAYLVLKK